MAPSVNLADDVAELSRAVAQLFRASRPPGGYASQLGTAAAAAGLSREQAAMFMQGLFVPPPRQGVALVNALLEQDRARRASYMTQLRLGHAGGDAMGASYAGKVTETAVLPRGRSEDRVVVRGGPVETTEGDVAATLLRLAKDWPSWKFEADGAESLATDKPKLGWHARARDGQGVVHGATSLEVAEKVQRIEADLAAEARRAEAFARG
jgi:hypothetical protein